MTEYNVAAQVQQHIQAMHQQGLEAVAVLMGHEDWMYFSTQSKVSYTPFGSARRYQPELGGLMMVRVDEMHCLQVVTQQQLDDYQSKHQTL